MTGDSAQPVTVTCHRWSWRAKTRYPQAHLHAVSLFRSWSFGKRRTHPSRPWRLKWLAMARSASSPSSLLFAVASSTRSATASGGDDGWSAWVVAQALRMSATIRITMRFMFGLLCERMSKEQSSSSDKDYGLHHKTQGLSIILQSGFW